MDIYFILLIVTGLLALSVLELPGHIAPVEAIIWAADEDGQLHPSSAGEL